MRYGSLTVSLFVMAKNTGTRLRNYFAVIQVISWFAHNRLQSLTTMKVFIMRIDDDGNTIRT